MHAHISEEEDICGRDWIRRDPKSKGDWMKTQAREESHGTFADHTRRNEFVNSKEGRALYGDEE